MMISKIKFKFLLIVLLASLFQSCEKEEDQRIAYGDVIIRSFSRGDSIVYGICYYAYSYETMKQVSVQKEGSTSLITLDSTEYRFTFLFMPDSLGYSTTKPALSKYTFNVEFDDGFQYKAYDLLDSIAIKPPVIKEYKFDTEDVKFTLDWEAIPNADQYRVVLENQNKEVVYQSDFFNASQSALWITSSSSGWLTDKQPDGGEKYRAIIIAYQYEPTPSVFDLQSISYTEGDYFQWLLPND